ncbi:MAG: DNA (cytosine-5-)-methyltransferase [Pirellulales bacterium]|nr:DNA (cytosine-5-)-methyltransferase [Pirellulales bacterium]
MSADKSLGTFAEFFAGIGLVRLALEQCGWVAAFANDIDAKKAEIYRHNWPDDQHLLLGDIHQIDVESLPSVELATGSFPCNDLSIAGKWDGLDGQESSAFWGLVSILDRLDERRPPLVLLENVVGFLQRNGGRDLETALLALNELDYSVDVMLIDAVRFTPQSRPRLFVVASQGQRLDRRTTSCESDVRPKKLAQFIHLNDHLRWDVRELPALPRSALRVADIVEDLPDDDPQWWNRERAEYFMGQLSPRHAEQAASMIAGPQVSYATAFRRVRQGRSMAELRVDGIAGCLRTPRGGSGRQILFAAGLGDYRVRLLTARECARLQGVSDDYVIDVPTNQALFGFGDAVCVPVIQWIATNYLGPLLQERGVAALTGAAGG